MREEACTQNGGSVYDGKCSFGTSTVQYSTVKYCIVYSLEPVPVQLSAY